jgi:aminoglycoside phosphotransferase (APT) family kinase protein
MMQHFNECVSRGGPWSDVPAFRDAIDRLSAVIDRIQTPLVFSSGDNNPANFLFDDEELTGCVDFTEAGFDDPHYDFAKFIVWSLDEVGWGWAVKCGMVERWLYKNNVSRREFAPRLLLRSLWDLQEEVPVTGDKDGTYRDFLWTLINDCLADLST